MIPLECPLESEVLAALRQSRSAQHLNPGLRDHLAACPHCSSLADVAAAFMDDRDELLDCPTLPDATRVWRLAQLRARREAVRTAGRPITAVQVSAFACASGLLGACFGATSTWFQSALARFDPAALFSSATTLLLEHGLFVLAMLAIVLLVPTAVFVALGRDN
jgi:hypothetical protein